MSTNLLEGLSQKPLPQVGAILNLDTELPSHLKGPDLLHGGRHWKLDGSCVLVTPNRVLTIRHSLEKYSLSAVFFPYEGFFLLAKKPEPETGQPKGDNLVLSRLLDKTASASLAEVTEVGGPFGSVEFMKPLEFKKIRKDSAKEGYALVCGFGRWPNTKLEDYRGLQQQQQVELGPRQASWRRHYKKLDLSWSSAFNGGKILGTGNSGGPLLWGSRRQDAPQGVPAEREGELPLSVVGINRERAGDQQIGSWIGRKRWHWLNKALREIRKTEEFAEPSLPLERIYRPLRIPAGGGDVVTLRVPPGATRLKATLNATRGLPLQMKIRAGGEADELLDSARADGVASGRFLFRDFLLQEGVDEVVVGVASVSRAPMRADFVLAQLCAMFL